MNQVLVVDTNSIMDLFKYYYFDRNNGAKLYKKLLLFLTQKVQSGELIIIDKVFQELRLNQDNEEFKRNIGRHVVTTTVHAKEVGVLIEKYRVKNNEREYHNDPVRINQALEQYETRHADLYLIAYAKYLASANKRVILITEESPSPDKKLVEKIPVICKAEGVECRNLPYSLFEIYKNELKFNL
ncbi:TPA: DUF4411 family protein [Candidatus Woesearchaeota archaeon]|nr:DUF4411 family protein [Candidatus Woesearchaeota archaeon]